MLAEPTSRCVWTKDVEESIPSDHRADVWTLPVAHGEGRLVCDSPEILRAIESSGRVALRYADNYNGSENAIAGLCDASGLVFGLMPHPERYLDWTRHPYWTRLPETVRRGPTPGLRMFQNAVAHVAKSSQVRQGVLS
jgi:phosphoribosylformylglycinamidine synthase